MSGKKFFGLLATISVSLFASSAAWSFDLANDTIAPSGSPAFYNNVTIDMNDSSGRLKMKGRGNFLFDTGTGFLNGTDSIFTLKAFYDSSGNLTTGGDAGDRSFIQIHGCIDGWSDGFSCGELLMSADINELNLTEDPNLWAFGTENIVCNPLLLITCTTNESIYVSLLGGFDGNFNNGKFKDSGIAITTVPIPAAAWLFGSALGLLGWVRSRNRRSMQAAV
jgi:hypothetical protein